MDALDRDPVRHPSSAWQRWRVRVVIASVLIVGAVGWFVAAPSAGPGSGSTPDPSLAPATMEPPLLAHRARTPTNEREIRVRPESTIAFEDFPPIEVDDAELPSDFPDGVRTASLRVIAYDALDGRTLDAHWRLRTPTAAPSPPPDPSAADPVAPADPARSWVADPRIRGSTHSARFRPESARLLTLVVMPPRGYLGASERFVRMCFARDQSVYVARVPLWPTTTLTVTVLRSDGAAAVGARLFPRIAEFSLFGSLLANSHGELEVPIVPIVPGVTVLGTVTWGAEPERADWIDAGVQAQTLAFCMPYGERGPFRAVLRLDGRTTPWKWEEEAEETVPSVRDGDARPASPAGTLVATLLSASGAPLADVDLKCGGASSVTGEDGVATLAAVRAGRQVISTHGDGVLGFDAEVVVVAGAVVHITLREPRGGVLHVEVIDDEGRAVPSALVSVGSDPRPGDFALDEDDLGFRIDRYADERGRRRFARVSPGPMTVYADSWGRTGSSQVIVEDQGTAWTRVVVR